MGKIGNVRIERSDGSVTELPVYDLSTQTYYRVNKNLRVNINGQTGFIPNVSAARNAFPSAGDESDVSLFGNDSSLGKQYVMPIDDVDPTVIISDFESGYESDNIGWGVLNARPPGSIQNGRLRLNSEADIDYVRRGSGPPYKKTSVSVEVEGRGSGTGSDSVLLRLATRFFNDRLGRLAFFYENGKIEWIYGSGQTILQNWSTDTVYSVTFDNFRSDPNEVDITINGSTYTVPLEESPDAGLLLFTMSLFGDQTEAYFDNLKENVK